MKIESVWVCKVCNQMVAGVYDGPVDREMIAQWAQSQHDKVSPDCPYKFQFMQFFPISGTKCEDCGEKGPF